MDGSRRLAYTEGRSVHHTAVPLTCSTFSRPFVHGVVFADAASPIGSACTLRFRRRSGRARRPSESGFFWPYMPLHPLQNMALNAYFSLFEIWPRFRPPQAHFASCFGPGLCICTNLDQTLSTPKSARNIAQPEAGRERRYSTSGGRVPAMSQRCGEVYGCWPARCTPVALHIPYTSIHPLRRGRDPSPDERASRQR